MTGGGAGTAVKAFSCTTHRGMEGAKTGEGEDYHKDLFRRGGGGF